MVKRIKQSKYRKRAISGKDQAAYQDLYSVAKRLLGESMTIDEDIFKEVLKDDKDYRRRKNKNKSCGDNLYIYFSEVGRYRLLTAQEEKILGEAIQQGDNKAFQCLVLGNLRLVVMIAQRYEERGLDIEDLISEGNLGLIHATHKYDPHKGCRFSTYAVWWIRHYIEKAIMDKSRTVRLPIHINKSLRKLIVVLHELSQKLHRHPTAKELSEHTGLSIHEVTDLLVCQQTFIGFDEHNVLENLISSGKNFVLQNNIVNDLIEHELFNLLEGILVKLDPDERAVIEYRFGINGKSEQTLDKTGEMLDLTRDQVRYLQTKTIEKIRQMLDENYNFELSDVLD